MKNFTRNKILLSCLFCIAMYQSVSAQENKNLSVESALKAHIKNILNKDNISKRSIVEGHKIFCDLDQLSMNKDKKGADTKVSKIKNRTETITYIEKEKEGINTNDIQSSSEFIPNLGSAKSKDNRVTIQGALLASDIANLSLEIKEINGQEDDGAIPIATPLLFDQPFQKIKTVTAIGDGPHGSSGTGKGDADYYKVTLKKGEAVEFNATATATSIVNLTSLVFDEEGRVLKFNVANTPGTTIYFEAPADGSYYFAVFDFQMIIKTTGINPFNSEFENSVIGDEGAYEIEVNFYGIADKDFYAFRLEKGDVLGVEIDATSDKNIELFTPKGELALFSDFSLSSIIYPIASPMPRNGIAGFNYVAPESGVYYLSASDNPGSYQMEVFVSRSGLELEKNEGITQVIYLNFAGEEEFTQRDFFNGSPRAIGIPEEELNKKRKLSPLGDFLKEWDIEDTPFNRFDLAAKITEVVKENLVIDLLESNINSNFDVVIISDYGNKYLRDYIPKFLNFIEMPFSKVIVGGTIEELGFPTIGTSSTVDSGNFLLTDQAIVLLDILSGTSPFPQANIEQSLNNYPIAEGIDRKELVAVALGNIATHEIGHFIGCSHTNNRNDIFSMMDQGSGFNAAGVLDGDMFGDENTIDVDFTKDEYLDTRNGVNHTDLQVAFALSTFPDDDDDYRSKKSSQLDALQKEIKSVINEPINFSEGISSYPNPQDYDEVSRLTFTSNLDGDASVTLYDIHGREVKSLFSGKIKTGQANEITLNPVALNLKSGIYIYHLKTPQGDKHHRIIIK